MITKYLKFISLIILFVLSSTLISCERKTELKEKPIKLAVEFVSHAAAAHIARAKGWYKAEGLNIESYDNYITGMALAAALLKGDIDAAYICLIPAISAYKNAGVKIKVVCGTHLYGYGLIVNPEKITKVQDLMKDDIKVACAREGSPADALMNKMIDSYNLDAEKLKNKILRMPPPKVLLSLKTKQIDAGFCCEQFPSLGEQLGFKELLTAKDLWSDMQGSVLVVTDDLIKNHPAIVKKLVKVTEKSIEYIHKNPSEASRIVAEELTIAGKKILPLKVSKIAEELTITPESIKRALFEKMICTPNIDIKMVQEEINYMHKLGYLKETFDAEEIMDLKFLR